MLNGLMQDDFALTLNHVRRRMVSSHPQARVVSATEHGVRHSSFGEVAGRVDRLGRVLERLGIGQGDRVGTFAWNNQSHFELYLAVPCSGAVLHTLNVRLFANQLQYIINHAEDQVIFVDASLVATLAELAPGLPGVRHYVVMGDGDTGSLPNALRYGELLQEAGEGPFAFPELDERQAASLCYTSGTTGNPKGVLYSHRSVCLHASGLMMTDALGLSRRDRVLAVVPMFHVNAWGLPYGAAMAGADLLLPDRWLDAEHLAHLIEDERPSLMGCVPTIFADLLRYADQHHSDLSSLTNAICGGAAVPRALMRSFQERHGVRIFQAWGMTETSPICTISRPPLDGEPDDAYWDLRATQGRAVPWVELRLINDDGEEVAWDGQGTGEIQVRGPWIAARYFGEQDSAEKFDRGWLRTGDIASVDPEGFVKITDRSKDVIKSGGEWISSVELEGHLMAHEHVLEAAVIAKPDERWSERPLCCVVLRPDASLSAEELVEHLRPLVARWWLPDEFAFIEEVPKTSVGKFDKKVLRSRLAADELANRVQVSAAASARAPAD